MLAPIAAVEDPVRRAEAERLDEVFREVTGWNPKLWGAKIGYGQYHYRYDSGREGDWLATGFGIGANEFSIYILPGYSEFRHIAGRLGQHRRGRSCWYIGRLSKINMGALRGLIRAGLADLEQHWPISPT